VLSERSPPSRTKLPRSACPTCAQRRSNHRVRSQSRPLNPPRALSLSQTLHWGVWGAQRASPRGRRTLGVKRAKPPIENQTPAKRMSHMREAAWKSPRALSIRPLNKSPRALSIRPPNKSTRALSIPPPQSTACQKKGADAFSASTPLFQFET